MKKQKLTIKIIAIGFIFMSVCFLSGIGHGEIRNDATWLWSSSTETKLDSSTQDSLNKICKVRGHIIYYSGITTLLDWAPSSIDLEDRTLWISHNPNHFNGQCLRCRRRVSVPIQIKADTTIIWKKEIGSE